MKLESPNLSKVLKALAVFSRGAENDSITYKNTLGTNGLLSEKDISDLRTSNSSIDDDLALLDWFSSVVIPHRREELHASIAFQTVLLTPLPPTNPEEHHFFYTAPYNDSAVSSLPSEILVEIFHWIGGLGSEYDDLNVKHGPNWVITHVCRTWRSIAVSTPSLWASISIEDDFLIDDPFTDGKAKLLQEYLSRSSQKPLRVALSSSYDIEKHIEILSPHLPRCTDLDFTVTAEAIHPHFTIEGEFPNLKRLSLVVEGCISDLNELPFISGEAPNLLDLLVQGIDISYVELPLTKLKSFTGDMCQYNGYTQLFSSASQLHTAKLELSTVQSSVCKALRLPALEVLHIEQMYPSEHHSIAELLRESGCPLRCLYLELAALPWSELRPIIEACSSTLESLSIRVNEESASQAHDALSFNKASHHLDTFLFRTPLDRIMHPRRQLFIGCRFCGFLPSTQFREYGVVAAVFEKGRTAEIVDDVCALLAQAGESSEGAGGAQRRRSRGRILWLCLDEDDMKRRVIIGRNCLVI
ncbi:hypothetical protein IW261DRAFT_1667383 [Armillaria novae-zelandiae]|uniref:F-box domain-containing protein n=1 Tax=Armillaria novae-zelandiae TaxID=153914 RepID=A0AA39NTL4_9AGAR|nr:hypothetical protein IW261DRAFT_1667383 [Armillaria novae-zelandiae]